MGKSTLLCQESFLEKRHLTISGTFLTFDHTILEIQAIHGVIHCITGVTKAVYMREFIERPRFIELLMITIVHSL